jgi:pimeloyl-ACP methyl ester carboxylesterase
MVVRAETPPAPRRQREQSRARYPAQVGVAERDGGRIAWEVYGSGDPPLVMVPPWQIVHSRVWKAQLAEFPRRHRCVAYDARGNGRSDRPSEPAVHAVRERAADLAAVMDATGVAAAVLVSLSSSANTAVAFGAEHPERVLGHVFVCPAVPIGQPSRSIGGDFESRLDSDEGWNKRNIHYWRRDYEGYLDHFFAQAFPEPHSTKQREDAVGYGLDTDPETLAATVRTAPTLDLDAFRAMYAAIRVPSLVIQGTDERISDPSKGPALAEAIPGARLVMLEGAGHIPNARDPIVVNLLIREFLRPLQAVPGDARP